MYKKGQAAMEYLMTYGWAILVIVIVLAILAFYLPTFIKAPEDCIFSQPGFSCNIKKPVIVSETGTDRVYTIFQLNNQQGQAITVKRVKCTTEPVGEITKPTATVDESIAGGGAEEFEVDCYNPSGTEILLMTPNSNFRGTLAIWYNFHDEVTGAPERLATATITGTVLEESS